mmetsp:Transcript_4687/g.10284  ORF Transcript_4687/g.10284 Transcript_4687/m.10284 type:complete len:85 (+) Transcript_4687:1835-2089(+)
MARSTDAAMDLMEWCLGETSCGHQTPTISQEEDGGSAARSEGCFSIGNVATQVTSTQCWIAMQNYRSRTLWFRKHLDSWLPRFM